MLDKSQIAAIFPSLAEHFVPAKAQGINATIQFDLSGENGGLYWLKIADGRCEPGVGQAENPTMTMKSSADDWAAILGGTLNATQAVMTGKVKIEGDWSLAMKMTSLFA
jgi:putative sterol carrier protein